MRLRTGLFMPTGSPTGIMLCFVIATVRLLLN